MNITYQTDNLFASSTGVRTLTQSIAIGREALFNADTFGSIGSEIKGYEKF